MKSYCYLSVPMETPEEILTFMQDWDNQYYRKMYRYLRDSGLDVNRTMASIYRSLTEKQKAKYDDPFQAAWMYRKKLQQSMA